MVSLQQYVSTSPKTLNLFYILCGHFDENKLGVPPYPGVG